MSRTKLPPDLEKLREVQESAETRGRSVSGKVIKLRSANSPNSQDQESAEGVSLDDFHAYMPQHSYIYAPSRESWPAASVNARIPPVPMLDASGKPAPDKDGEQ